MIAADQARTGADADETARTAGRGGMAVLGAKVFFLVVGFAQKPLLKWAIGLSDFGGLAQANVVANIVNNVVISSGTQGVSRIVAGAKGAEEQAFRATLRVHAPLAIVIAAGMALAVPFYARFEHAQDVVTPLYVLAGVALLYGLYAPLIGFLNGTNRFTRQAALDMTFATLRTLGLVGVGRLFIMQHQSGLLGVTAGWVVAALCIVPLAARATGWGRPLPRGGVEAQPRGVPSSRAYLAVLSPIAGAQLCTNLLMQVDIALLGRFLSESAETAGLTGEAQRAAVKAAVGIYSECQTFAFLPYQLLFSITLVLFPMLARARAEGDDAAVRAYVLRGSRLAALFGGLLVGVIVALPESLLSFAYGDADAARGADVLRVMALGQGAFAMLGIAMTVLTSIGREKLAASVTLAAVVAVGGACVAMARGKDFGHDGHALLVHTAYAMAAALAATLVVAAVIVRARTGAFVPMLTALRTALALGGCLALGFFLPHFGKHTTPFVSIAVAAAYFVVLVVTREVGRADLAMARALVPGRRK